MNAVTGAVSNNKADFPLVEAGLVDDLEKVIAEGTGPRKTPSHGPESENPEGFRSRGSSLTTMSQEFRGFDMAPQSQPASESRAPRN